MNLRLRGTPLADSQFNLQKLYYLSVHTLDGLEGAKYAKSRVGRELLDLWLEKKLGFGGVFFNDTEENLTEEDPCLVASDWFSLFID